MITFSLYLLGIALIPVVMLLPSLLSAREPRRAQRNRENIQIARERLEAVKSAEQPDNPIAGRSSREIESDLLQDLESESAPDYRKLSPIWGILIVILIPLSSYVLYSQVGEPELATSVESRPQMEMDIDQLLAGLEANLAENPGDISGWVLAGQTYMSLQNYEKAKLAYATLNSLSPDNPDYLASLADATIMVSGNIYASESQAMVEKALALNPNHVNALWLASLGSMSLGEYSAALGYLGRLRIEVTNDPASLEQVDLLIARGKQLTKNASSPDSVLSVGREVTVRVDVDPSVSGLIDNSETLYVFAKAPGGLGAPVAVSKTAVSDFPVIVTLDDSMAVVPGMTISNFDELAVGARISRSGNAISEPGDLESSYATVGIKPDNKQVYLLIDKVNR